MMARWLGRASPRVQSLSVGMRSEEVATGRAWAVLGCPRIEMPGWRGLATSETL